MPSRRLAALAAAVALCLAVPFSRGWFASAEPQDFPESGKASPSPLAAAPVMNRGDLGFRGTTLQTRMAPPDPHIAARMRVRLEQLMHKYQKVQTENLGPTSENERRQLRSLGYADDPPMEAEADGR